jgi:hypothetical protein
MKKITLLAVVLGFNLLVGQSVFYSGFESWTSGIPDQWNGSQTNIGSTNIIQVTSGAFEGNYAVLLVNTSTTSHKRFSTQPLTISQGQVFKISFYARGSGKVRVGLYDGNAASNQYSSYTTLTDSINWQKITATLIADTNSSVAEFIISVLNVTGSTGRIQVDSFYVQLGSTINATIHDIQYTTDPSGDSPYKGQAVKTHGVVTAVYPNKAYWIQDGTGPFSGLYVYDNAHHPSIGDSIELVGTVDEYYNLTELKSISIYNVLASNRPIYYNAISLADAQTEAYESVLVQFTNVVCTNTNAGHSMWTIGDGMDTLLVDTLLYKYTPTLNKHYNIQGVMYYSYSKRKILPRFASDIVVNTTGLTDDQSSPIIYPNPFTDLIFFENVKGLISVYNSIGKKLYEVNLAQDHACLNLGYLPAGTYFMRIETNNNTYYKTIIKQ